VSENRIVQSKRKFRRQLADHPIGQKLRMLDRLRERALTIQRARDSTKETDRNARGQL
jgi:hypothetical protein